MVTYAKPALTVADQVALLQSRGVQGDPAEMAKHLADVSYYRLSGYTFPYRQPGPLNAFRPGTTFDQIWEHYVFDRQLRLLVLDAIERVEVSLRTRVSYEYGHAYGPFGLWTNPQAVQVLRPRGKIATRQDVLQELRREVERSGDETFLAHFARKYGDFHLDPPVWILTEVLSFGSVVRLADNAAPTLRKKIAAGYGTIPDDVLMSWMKTLNVVRNVCAHHSRLWNRVFTYTVKIPARGKFPDWHRPQTPGNDRIFIVLTILRYLLTQVSPGSQWDARLRKLLDEHPNVSRSSMGFTAGWETSPIWTKVK